jgi:RNA polymerase sigma factor (sigma-70 family)
MSLSEELFAEYDYLCKNTVYKMFKNPDALANQRRMQKEDLISMAREGLWKACLKWKPEGGRTFKNFAIHHIRWELSQRLEKESRIFKFSGTTKTDRDFKLTAQLAVDSMDAQLKNDEESNTYHDVIGNGYCLEDEIMNSELVEYIRDTTSPEVMDMIIMRSEGNTLETIAQKYGLSRERIRQKIVQVRKHLKDIDQWEVGTV